MISAKLACLFLALLLIFASLGIVEARQLFLNVFVDNTNTKQVLVVGNVDDPVALPFLNFLSSTYNGSIVLDVQGFDLTDPEVSLSYRAA